MSKTILTFLEETDGSYIWYLPNGDIVFRLRSDKTEAILPGWEHSQRIFSNAIKYEPLHDGDQFELSNVGFFRCKKNTKRRLLLKSLYNA